MMVTCVIQLFTLVLFIAAVDATSSPVACSFLAILLHYLLLCPTVAMVLDATLLRRKVFKVLQCTWRKEIRLRRAIVSVFAIPLLVIFVAFGSTKVQQHGSSGEFKYCSVNTYSMLIFGIATPIAVAVSYNVVMLLMVARIQQQKSKEMPLRIINSPTLEQWKTSLKTCMFLTAQLGVTWILGLLALLTQAGELHYTFAVLNVTQGFAIFLLTLRSKEGTLDMAAESAAFSRRVQAASLHLITVFTNDGARIVNRNPMVECRL
ncbi:adhesion G protein-coupled receptor E5-like isoform X2 [Sycon ciliatum]